MSTLKEGVHICIFQKVKNTNTSCLVRCEFLYALSMSGNIKLPLAFCGPVFWSSSLHRHECNIFQTYNIWSTPDWRWNLCEIHTMKFTRLQAWDKTSAQHNSKTDCIDTSIMFTGLQTKPTSVIITSGIYNKNEEYSSSAQIVSYRIMTASFWL